MGSSRKCFDSTAPTNSPYFTDPTGFGGQSRDQFFGPGYFNTDFMFLKGFKVPGLESGMLQIGVQAYNILNHPNFLNPDTNYSDGPGFGVITETARAKSGNSSRLQSGVAPARLATSPPMRFAKLAVFSTDHSCSRPCRNAAAKASPAPTVSTTLTRNPGKNCR